MLLKEFQSFFGLNWYDLYETDARTFENSQYFPPALLDQVWKLLILDTQKYEKMCMELCGKYVDRLDPLCDQNPYGKYSIYQVATNCIKDELNIWDPIITKYADVKYYTQDHSYILYLTEVS